MLWLVKFSIARSKLILGIFTLLTVISLVVIVDKSSIAIDPTKSFSRKMDVIKYFNLMLKKFSMKDTILIGVENNADGVFDVATLRYVEKVMNRIKDLKLKKKYKNIITGKQEEVTLPTDIAVSGIKSIINGDVISVDKKSNTIVIGNLTSKARSAAGLISGDENEISRLPRSEGDLKKLLPYLKDELRRNRLYRGTYISNNEKSCTILVPIEKRLDKKKEVLRNTLYYMVSVQKMRDRFSGSDFDFPHPVYKKTVAGISVNDEYINATVKANKTKLKKFFITMFSDLPSKYRVFKKYLKDNEVDDQYVTKVLAMIEDDGIYLIPGVDRTYQDLVDNLYTFTIGALDPLNRNNLEGRLYNVKDIFDVGHLYRVTSALMEKDKPSNVKTYIAGRPIAEALIEEYVINDMSIFLSLTIIVMIIILYVSFRTVVGIFLPLLTSIIAAIWVMGAMLLLGVPFSSGTIAMPSIIIALGISDIIYFLSRYYESTITYGITDVNEAILEATDHVWVAVTLSELTCMTAFLSNVTSVVIDISMMSMLVSAGLFLNLIFTFSFVPAVLRYLPVPKSRKRSAIERSTVDVTLRAGKYTYNHSRLIFLGSVCVTAIFAIGLFQLKTESSITTFFTRNSPIVVADRFINRNLMGTGQMCIIFKMRDKVDVSSEASKNECSRRIDGFISAYGRFLAAHPELKKAKSLNAFFTSDISDMKTDLTRNREGIMQRIGILTDMSNQFYEFAPAGKNAGDTGARNRDTGPSDIDSLSDNDLTRLADQSAQKISPRDAGISDIIGRIPVLSTAADRTAGKRAVAALRRYVGTGPGSDFLGSLNALSDFFQTDITQPATLRKIDALEDYLKSMKEPKAYVDDVAVNPIGSIMSVTDPLKLIYKIFYHENDDAYEKIPDVAADRLRDRSLTDRGVIGVCMSQFRGSSDEIARYLMTDDMKMMQFVVFTKSDKADFLSKFSKRFYAISAKLFPGNDPYVEKVVISGMPAINMAMNHELYIHHIQSICLTIFVVFLCCLWIFRSFSSAVFSIIPLSITVIINIGLMGFFDFPINYATVINASIAIGAGIDFTIHFLERFKYEHFILCKDFRTSYFNTLETKGDSILISAFAIAGGFSVLMLSSFKMLSMSGFLIALAMLLSAAASIIVLPAMLNWLKPDFIENREKFMNTKPLILKYLNRAGAVSGKGEIQEAACPAPAVAPAKKRKPASSRKTAPSRKPKNKKKKS